MEVGLSSTLNSGATLHSHVMHIRYVIPVNSVRKDDCEK